MLLQICDRRGGGGGGRGQRGRARTARLRTDAFLDGGGVETASFSSFAASMGSTHPGLVASTVASTVVTTLGYGVLSRGLDVVGVANSFVLGALAYGAFGYRGYALVVLYFVAGTAVTKLKLREKQAEGIAEARGGRRTWRSVWGSGAAATLCAAWYLSGGAGSSVAVVGFAASFASKLGDTTSSEVGKAYGKRTFLSTNFQEVSDVWRTPPLSRCPRVQQAWNKYCPR